MLLALIAFPPATPFASPSPFFSFSFERTKRLLVSIALPLLDLRVVSRGEKLQGSAAEIKKHSSFCASKFPINNIGVIGNVTFIAFSVYSTFEFPTRKKKSQSCLFNIAHD